MTKSHLLGVAKVRRSLIVPIVVFTSLNAATHAREFRGQRWWIPPAYLLFDSLLWIGVAFLIFAVIEWRQTLRPQPRLAAMAAATVGIASLTAMIVTLRAFFESVVMQVPFVAQWLVYFPGSFLRATFYVAIVTGIGYGVYSWAVEDQRMAEEAELDAAVARAELKAASGRLQPELLDVALRRLSTLMATNAAAAQHLISDLGALLHDSLAHSQSTLVTLGNELDYVERYLDFHGIRVSIDADAETRSRQIPHLAVLALVQNAIEQSTHRDLSIHATTEAGIVRITVSEYRDWRVEIELPAA